MDPQELICKDLNEIWLTIQNRQLCSDETLFETCRLPYSELSAIQQKIVNCCLYELLERRYHSVIEATCCKLTCCKLTKTLYKGKAPGRKRKNIPYENDYVIYEKEALYDYVIKELEDKLTTGSFFPSFQSTHDFASDFKKTLALYITRYFFPNYMNKRISNSYFSAYDVTAVEAGSEQRTLEPGSEERTLEKQCRDYIQKYIAQQYKKTKFSLFKLLCQLSTSWVREELGDAQIHAVTKDGVKKGRSLAATCEKLDRACAENAQRQQDKWIEDHQAEKKLVAIFHKKKVHWRKIESFQKDRSGNAQTSTTQLEDIQKRYEHLDSLEKKEKKLRKNRFQFWQLSDLQLSYPTLASVLNTTLSCCYKWRTQLRKDWGSEMKKFLNQ